MTAYVNGEVGIFLWSLLSGAIIMMTYDFFSVFTSEKNLSIFVLNIFDGIFVVCSTTVMIFVLLNVSNGYVRSYEFIGAAIGGILYKITLSRLVKLIFYRIIDVIYAIFHFFCKILLTPIEFMYKIVCNTVGVLIKLAKRSLSPILRQLSLVKISLKKT